jgi:Bacterial PH domain
MDTRPPSGGPGDAFAVFRPRRGRMVALTGAIVAVSLFALIAVLLPGPGEGGTWRAADRVFFAACGPAIAAMLWRYATIRAVPTRTSLTIRNLLLTREVPWDAIVSIQFSGGDPWVTLDLDDTDTIAVMAIQKADGPWGRQEASRLAALVQALGIGGPAGGSSPAGPDGPGGLG